MNRCVGTTHSVVLEHHRRCDQKTAQYSHWATESMTSKRNSDNIQHKNMPDLPSSESILELFGLGFIIANSDLSIVHISPFASRWISSAKYLSDALAEVYPGKTAAEWSTLSAAVMSSHNPVRLIGVIDNEPTDRQCELPIALAKYPGQSGTKDQLLVLLGPMHHDGAVADTNQQPDPLAALGKLTARIAHELNNPLDGISRYVNLALRIADDTDPSKLKHYLNESQSGLLRMTRIITDLLEYSRSVSATEEMSLQRIVEDAIQAVSVSANMDGIVVAVNFKTTNLPTVVGPRLYQVCCNLIKNAVDAMPTGGRLTITVGTANDTVLLCIEDTGSGLPSNTEQMFEPFYTTKKPGEGTGLGLAICKEYMAGMGGTIQATSGEDGGAVLTIVIPIDQLQIGNDR